MSLYFILVGALIILPIDLYYYRAVKKFVEQFAPLFRKAIKISYWIYTVATLIFLWFVASYFTSQQIPPKFARVYLFGCILIVLVSKLVGSMFIILHDVKTLLLFLKRKIFVSKPSDYSPSRKEFLKKAAIIASIIPFGTLMYGVFKSAFDFRIRKQKLIIPNLPSSFTGLKIIQISDLHLGSFLSDEPLKEVVQMIKAQNPDLIFFTGDLVNEVTEEAFPFMDVLTSIRKFLRNSKKQAVSQCFG